MSNDNSSDDNNPEKIPNSRDIWELESIGFSKNADVSASPEKIENEILVDIDFPKPAYLSKILTEVSKWSGYNFVMDPKLNREIQIFAPRKLPEADAFQVFIASLETIGLRALQMDGKIVKIVPLQIGKIAI